MYLQGVITIDPSQLTHLERAKPTKGFARMAYLLTGGLFASQEERETFCAVTILQQINLVMRSLGIDNIVRLSKDDQVIFEDKKGEEGDLKKALDQFSSQLTGVGFDRSVEKSENRTDGNPEGIVLFDTLELLLEHHTYHHAYLIQIRINRSHRVGEHPIQITLNGLPNELAGDGEKKYDRGPLNQVFSSQKKYNSFMKRHKSTFTDFLSDIESAFKKHMKVDEVDITSRVKIIRPSKRVQKFADVPQTTSDYYDPYYGGHYGYGESYLYPWLWADSCHSNRIRCSDCTIVDSTGADVLTVGADGFQAGEGDTMNVDQPFTPPSDGDVQVSGSNEYAAEIADSSRSSGGSGDSGSGDSGGWLSSVFGDSGGDGGGSSCGGSSCGGGCGGCGG